MKFLQLVEGAYHVALICQLFSGFAEVCLYFEVFLEVVFARLVVELKQVVVLLYVQLVVAPQLVGLFRRHELYLPPFQLQLLEFLVRLVRLFGRGHHGLDLFYYVKFLLEVFLFLFFLFQEYLGAFLFYYAHFRLELVFVLVRRDFVIVWVAAAFKIGLHCGFPFGEVQFVERCLEVFHLVFLRVFAALCYFFKPFYYFFLVFIHLLGLGRVVPRVNSFGASRSFLCGGGFFAGRWCVVGIGLYTVIGRSHIQFFCFLLTESVFLRVHHSNFFLSS